jgi:hypothetical protein
MNTRLQSLLIGLTLAVSITGLIAQNTVVTYQGRVQSGGSDFTGAGQFKFALVTVTNTAATATATANPPSGGFITVINVTFGGNGYVTPPAVTITGGGGSGATASTTLTGGAVTSITVNNTGSGYTSAPTVTIAPPRENLAYTTYWSNDGTSVAGSEPVAAVSLPVNAGVVTARLGDASVANMTALPDSLFSQPNLHLRLWFDDGVNGFAGLQPTQPLTAAPYAFTAGSASNLLGTVTAANLSGTYSQPVTLNNAANSFSGSGAGLTSLNASQLATGTVPDDRLAANVARTNQVWLLGGNATTSFGYQLLGTTDNKPLAFVVNGERVLSLAADPGDAVRIIGGSPLNSISGSAEGSIIAGGGFNSDPNEINSGSVGSTISGGAGNTIMSDSWNATIAGGFGHTVSNVSFYATILGGSQNTIQAGGFYAVALGGQSNSATNYALAAGRRAKANHRGAFVWADSQSADFASTATNQFNVRANGGARFATSGMGLTVDGPITASTFTGEVKASVGGAGTPGLAFSADDDTGLFRPTANTLALATGGAERLRVNSAGAVGIGETAPEGQLHITGPQTTPQIMIETTANNSFVKMRLESQGKPYWDFAVGGTANVMNWFYSGTSQNLMSLATNGTLTTIGPVNPPSDRNVKQDFAAVDAVAVLEKVAALPIQSWAYKNSPDTRHIGPVAQDFHAAFGLNGADDKHIATVDADGVALAAIQGLNQKLEETRAENAALRRELSEIKKLLTELATQGN